MGNKKSSVLLHDDETKQISLETGFTPRQIERFYARFLHLDRLECGKLSRWDLLAIPELAINPLCDRLMEMFFPNGDCEERITFKQFVEALSAVSYSQAVSNGSVNRRWQRRDSLHSRTRQTDGEKDNVFDAYPTNCNNNKGSSSSSCGVAESGSKQMELMNHCCTENYANWWAGFMFKVYDIDRDGRVGFADIKSILRLMVGKFVEESQLDKISRRVIAQTSPQSSSIDYRQFSKTINASTCCDKFRLRLLT